MRWRKIRGAICAEKSRALKADVGSLHSQISDKTDERDQPAEGERLDHVKVRSSLPDFGHRPIPSFKEAVQTGDSPHPSGCRE